MEEINPKKLTDFNLARSLEWIETNGIGGYASGTVSGAHSRGYHGLLVAAVNPPVGRMVVASKLEEILVIGGERFELSSNQYPDTVHPNGYQFLAGFERDLFPVFRFHVGGVEIKKTIASIHGENTTVILYEVIKAPKGFTMELLPLYGCRDFHSLMRANDSIHSDYTFQDGLFKTQNYDGCPELFISVPGSSFVKNKAWFYNFEYSLERERGLNFCEDLYTHGNFSLELKKGSVLGIILSTKDPTARDAVNLFEHEKRRREEIKSKFSDPDLKTLALAAEQFVVGRGDLKTVIAGYHWFSDWGRDTMIALPGLCLVTGKFEDAKKVLNAFAGSVNDGMLPNRFPDYGEKPEYNTIDATLWFFHAIYKYHQYTGDISFIKTILPVLKNIIDWHYKGTRYHIHVDREDELLSGGEDSVQLTWMDAKVDNWVVTPRKGKPVEINALWYNALSIMSFLLTETGAVAESEPYRSNADKVRKSFNEKFWNSKNNSLFDCIDGENKDASVRPNQLYAISLPYPLLSKEKSLNILKIVQDELLTSRGLRSLTPSHPDYKKEYVGDRWQRDGAYHQGTVWGFLTGAYVDALVSVKGDKGRSEASGLLKKFLEHLNEAGVGTISEIFDGEPPHAPRGCIAQAWSVAEVLRVMVEYKL
jgi:predicted glycogen debranching enzyme